MKSPLDARMRLIIIATSLALGAGLALVAYGAWLIYAPAGYIVGGLALMALAVLIDLGTAERGR